MNYYIIVFKNTHDAMCAEEKLEKLDVKFRMMPTPTAITQSCGICVRIEDENFINKIINEEIIEFKNIYQKNSEGYLTIK